MYKLYTLFIKGLRRKKLRFGVLPDSNRFPYIASGKSLKHIVMLLPFQGATAPTRDTQGVATLALG